MDGGWRPPEGPLTPQLKRSLDTRTKIVPYTIIFKLVPKFKLLHKREVTVAQGTILYSKGIGPNCRLHVHKLPTHVLGISCNDTFERYGLQPVSGLRERQRPSIYAINVWCDRTGMFYVQSSAFHSRPTMCV